MVRVEKRRRKKRRSKNKEEYENDLRTRERAQVVFFEGRGWVGALLKWVQLECLFAMFAFPFSLGYIFKKATER